MKVIEPTGTTLEELQAYLADIVSVVRDKSPKNNAKLWDRLLKESYGNTASRVFEFIPCKLDELDFTKQQLFGFAKDGAYCTNARELLNWGWSVKEMLDTVDFSNYKAIKCEAPYFIYGQLSTHTQITSISHSQRYSECDRGYWKPKEVIMSQEAWDLGVGRNWRRWELREKMQSSGVKRREVFERGSDMLQNRVFTLGGYTSNPNAWKHFIEQRTDNHTQLETRVFVQELQGHIGI